MDSSVVAIGIVVRESPRGEEFLLRWSPHWRQWNLLSGHLRPGESFRECVVRKMEDELELPDSRLWRVDAFPCARIGYVATSGRTGRETRFQVEAFYVDLAAPENLPGTTSGIMNLWATAEEVASGNTKLADPISAMSRRVMDAASIEVA